MFLARNIFQSILKLLWSLFLSQYSLLFITKYFHQFIIFLIQYLLWWFIKSLEANRELGKRSQSIYTRRGNMRSEMKGRNEACSLWTSIQNVQKLDSSSLLLQWKDERRENWEKIFRRQNCQEMQGFPVAQMVKKKKKKKKKKKSAFNAQDLGLIPGLGRSPREGNGYPL